MKSSGRRNNIDIIADMLYIARDGALKTQLVYKCNLNFKIIKKYLGELIDRGLIEFNPPQYFSTEKADTYLIRYEALKNV